MNSSVINSWLAVGVLSSLGMPVWSADVDRTFEIAGNAELELTAYTHDGQFADQDYRYNVSVAAEPEFYWEWDDARQSVVFRPFIRGDQHDAERSHGDIRELSWLYVGDTWEWRLGVRKVFWGVTEFNHLVDVINQTDGVDSLDGEEKLGQPMINLSRVTDWGIVDFFVLPGFRERTFAGTEGRLRGGSVVNTDNAIYESSQEEKHVDYAVRWSHSVDVFDLGVYWFDGTDREPLLQQQTINGSRELVPFYRQARQLGVDLQATIDSWLWKLEAIHKDVGNDRFLASQAGFEYTFYGLGGSVSDLGVLLEYGWDQRRFNASSTAQNDIYLGGRWTLNDANDTSLLAGVSYDVDYHSRSLLVEASRRLNDHWTVALEGAVFQSDSNSDPVAALVEDDRLQLVLERYF